MFTIFSAVFLQCLARLFCWIPQKCHQRIEKSRGLLPPTLEFPANAAMMPREDTGNERVAVFAPDGELVASVLPSLALRSCPLGLQCSLLDVS